MPNAYTRRLISPIICIVVPLIWSPARFIPLFIFATLSSKVWPRTSSKKPLVLLFGVSNLGRGLGWRTQIMQVAKNKILQPQSIHVINLLFFAKNELTIEPHQRPPSQSPSSTHLTLKPLDTIPPPTLPRITADPVRNSRTPLCCHNQAGEEELRDAEVEIGVSA